MGREEKSRKRPQYREKPGCANQSLHAAGKELEAHWVGITGFLPYSTAEDNLFSRADTEN